MGGGEEFALILPEIDDCGARAIAENIREKIIELAIPHKESPVYDYVTVSIGVVTVEPTSEESVEKILTQVDELLYLAKNSGRNRVESVTAYPVGGGANVHLVQLIWKEDFDCGNQLIDSQHKDLFDISNKLLESIIVGRPSSEVASTMEQLLDNVNQHFIDEEKILQELNFPDIDQHIKEHAKLLEKSIELSNSFKDAPLTNGDVFQFLVQEGVVNHMTGMDREYYSFIKEEV